VGRNEWGSRGSIRVAFLVRGRGRGPRSGLFWQARRSSHEEVGVLGRSHGARLKKRMGLRLLARGSDEQVGLVNQVHVVYRG
jgi:hypothetical protein